MTNCFTLNYWFKSYKAFFFVQGITNEQIEMLIKPAQTMQAA